MSTYSMLSHSIDSSFSNSGYYGLQLVNSCLASDSTQVIGGELTVEEYDKLYQSYSYLQQASRGSIPSRLYGKDGDLRISIVEIFEDVELFAALARDKKGSQFIQQYFSRDQGLCDFLYGCLLDADLICPLSKDVFGNFVVQKIVEEAQVGECADEIFDQLKSHFYSMCKNRYSCRVAQKMLVEYPVEKVNALLSQIHGCEVELINDPHASHVMQKVVTTQPAKSFSFIVHALTSHESMLKETICNKYGCRVIQMCVDRLVYICQAELNQISLASSLLDKLIHSILKHSFDLSKDEFANYVIQFIIITDYLEKHRLELIHTVVLTNVLELSQERYASHVLEKILLFAPTKYLSAIIDEIMPSSSGHNNRDKFQTILFNQYGNYVIQRLLEILIEVRNGARAGCPSWFDRLAKRLIQHESNLLKYSSGKKIIEVLELEIGDFSKY